MGDPLTQAIVDVIENILQRGVTVQPREDGWLIKVADVVEDSGSPNSEKTEPERFSGRLSRSW